MDGAARVTRLLITGLRGWERLDLRPDGHVPLAGVPRAGRTDIIMALARVFDPHAARNPLLSDLHRGCPAPGAGENRASNTPPVGTTRVECPEVKVTLTDFNPDVQQSLDGYLEPLDPSGQASERQSGHHGRLLTVGVGVLHADGEDQRVGHGAVATVR